MPDYRVVGMDKYNNVVLRVYFFAKDLKDANAQVKEWMPERGEYAITPHGGEESRRLRDVLQR